MKRLDKTLQDKFFAELGDRLQQPAKIYVFGGTSLICLQMPNRLTDDFDGYTANNAELKAALQQLATEYQVPVDDLEVASISETPVDLAKPPITYGQFGNLSVLVVDPNLTAVGKLDRAGPDDIDDLNWMFASGLLDLPVLEKMIIGARGMESKPHSVDLYNTITGRNFTLPVAPVSPTRKRRWWQFWR